MKILGLGLVALAIILGGVPAFAADINAAQMVQIDQSGTRNNIDVTSGTLDEVTHVTNVDGVDTVTEVTHVTNVDGVDVVTEVSNVTSVDVVDTVTGVTTVSTVNTVTELAHVTNIDGVDVVTEVAHITNLDSVDVVTEVANVTSVDIVDSVTSVGLGTFTLKDATTGNQAKVFSDGAVYVKSTAEAGDSKSSYFVSVAVTANTEIDAGTYAVTAGKTYYINNMSLVASGLATLRVMSGATEIARVMTTPSCQTAINPKYQAITVATGTTITLKVKNRESSAMDIACSIEGSEK